MADIDPAERRGIERAIDRLKDLSEERGNAAYDASVMRVCCSALEALLQPTPKPPTVREALDALLSTTLSFRTAGDALTMERLRKDLRAALSREDGDDEKDRHIAELQQRVDQEFALRRQLQSLGELSGDTESMAEKDRRIAELEAEREQAIAKLRELTGNDAPERTLLELCDDAATEVGCEYEQRRNAQDSFAALESRPAQVPVGLVEALDTLRDAYHLHDREHFIRWTRNNLGHHAGVFMRSVLRIVESTPGSFTCPDCGPRVKADEDGCCASCGLDCEIVESPPDPRDARIAELEADRSCSMCMGSGYIGPNRTDDNSCLYCGGSGVLHFDTFQAHHSAVQRRIEELEGELRNAKEDIYTQRRDCTGVRASLSFAQDRIPKLENALAAVANFVCHDGDYNKPEEVADCVRIVLEADRDRIASLESQLAAERATARKALDGEKHFHDLWRASEQALGLLLELRESDDFWCWSDTDDNHLESMGESMLVRMTAGQLRRMLESAPDRAALAAAKGTTDGHD